METAHTSAPELFRVPVGRAPGSMRTETRVGHLALWISPICVLLNTLCIFKEPAMGDQDLPGVLVSGLEGPHGICHRLAIAPDTENFSTNWMGQEVTGATLGIIGMGSIGYKIAQRAKAFDMKILYHNRKRRKLEEEEAVGATYCESLDDLLQRSDFVLLAVSLTPQTQRLIGKRELNMMKPTAILVNIGRGLLVDQDALVQALQTGVIKGAALDVTHPEPLPRDHPLLKLENVTLTPHAGSATHQARRQMMENLVASILASLHGLPIPNEVRLNWDNSVA
ncbi:probable 2-ketogluconate reductase isoform X3 [Neofelis nebulosa]|uniref:probable 2-ketogluconate reductase isoform X3 n=1 Tax=Neofelis nebulosa TaxID=61452 RepID=UPI00272CD196|nr:probable 2-ketogluconate reductase isoform X3 [Neofelis nebulosa]